MAWPSPKTTFSGDTKFRQIPLGSADPSAGSLYAVRIMNEPQIDFSDPTAIQLLQWPKKVVVSTVTGNRHMDIVDTPAQLLRDRISQRDACC